MMEKLTQASITQLRSYAQQGLRITWLAPGAEKAKTLWGGLGNRAGLHSFAYELLAEKWEKSGERFMKKLDKVEGGTVQVLEFRNITRDRGRWLPARNIRLS